MSTSQNRSRLNPILREELRHLLDRTPAQTWHKPERVTLIGPRRLVTLSDLTYGHYVDLQELEFELHRPRDEFPPHATPVRPRRDILEQFLLLSDAPAPQIHEFASRFGPLLIFCKTKEWKSDRLVLIEECEVWRYVAACMKSLLHITACYHSGRRPDPADWHRIGACPPSLKPTGREVYDPLSPVSWGGEHAFHAMTYFVGKGSDRDRKMWTRLLNSFLELGRVRPWVVWEGSGSSARPKLVFSGPNLLSYLSLQLCLMASKQDAFALCSYCNREYTPTRRAPKHGQRNFCPDCRDYGVPVKLAQRHRRERLRAVQRKAN